MRVTRPIVGVTALLLGMGAAGVSAHAGIEHDLSAPGAFSRWDIGVLCLLVAAGALYATGTVRLARRAALHRAFPPVAFACGLSALLAAALPPLDALAVDLFSVHMAQHELMMLVGAPLVVLGRPLPVWLIALPQPLAQAAARMLQRNGAARSWRLLTAPSVAWALHGATIWVWHLPRLYETAVMVEGVHAAQHGMFVASAMLFWWGLVHGRYGRAGYGVAVLYVFTTAVHTGILGAMFTFARVPLYQIYVNRGAAHGVDVLADQELAGLLMWIPAGLLFTGIGLALFAAWLAEAERRTTQNERLRNHSARTASART